MLPIKDVSIRNISHNTHFDVNLLLILTKGILKLVTNYESG